MNTPPPKTEDPLDRLKSKIEIFSKMAMMILVKFQ
jgi:hypothetical protein